MWRDIGSVHSGDAHSQRSKKRLSPDQHYEAFLKGGSVSLPRDHNRSFSIDYIKKKRENTQNLTFESHIKSEKSLNFQETAKDLFTSIRQVISKEEQIGQQSSYRNADSSAVQGAGIQLSPKKHKLHANLKKMKKQQHQLQNWLTKEFNSFKNMMLQMEDTVYQNNKGIVFDNVQPEQKNKKENVDFFREIITDVQVLKSYFAEMDLKKEAILRQLE